MKKSLVITSISAPNTVMCACSEECHKHEIDFIVIGDTKSPPDFYLPGCHFLNIENQRKLPFGLAALLPEEHYSRKNIGYLIAMDNEAEIIIETDDDNFPMNAFWSERITMVKSHQILNAGWVNVYKYFTDAVIWPRGFPLEHVRNLPPTIDDTIFSLQYCPIQQGLADDNPDVDAIFRFTRDLPLKFNYSAPIAVGNGTWSPFNSQNTTWFKETFLLLYLPSFCSFRMCDIWRSFVALRICWANDWNILFHAPTVYQERNEHDLLKDFSDETIGYLNNLSISRELEMLDIAAGAENIPDGLIKCYEVFIRKGLVNKNEIKLLEKWIVDVMDRI